MKITGLMLVLLSAASGQTTHPNLNAGVPAVVAETVDSDKPFAPGELKRFISLDPIDAHTHVYEATPGFYAMLTRLGLHILDIEVSDDTDSIMKNVPNEGIDSWRVVLGSDHRVALCTTFDAYRFGTPGFAQEAILKINQDFERGAVAVKLYKNFGMEIKDKAGNYVMPNDPALDPILDDIAAHNKTLVAHLADPDSVWQAPNRAAPDYDYLLTHQEFYMYGRAGAPSKAEILTARDAILKKHPTLRVVGAHLGSMESNLSQLGDHLDQYPNFAVDLAARMPFFKMQPRDKMVAFILKYQDRLIYGTDNEIYHETPNSFGDWEIEYATDWRFLATNGISKYQDRRVDGLALPASVLRKIYHSNAITWFPGILNKTN